MVSVLKPATVPAARGAAWGAVDEGQEWGKESLKQTAEHKAQRKSAAQDTEHISCKLAAVTFVGACPAYPVRRPTAKPSAILSQSLATASSSNSWGRMGKQKKTRKFAEVKRLLNPKDLE